MKEKIQKILANAGLGSRRFIEKLIFSQKICINGEVVKIGLRINKNQLKDIMICGKIFDVKKIKNLHSTQVILYHKKNGELCTNSKIKNRINVFENLPKLKYGKWISVGRLDLNTSGVLLFTSNGELANFLMHPQSQIEREYMVRVFSYKDSKKNIDILKKGIKLKDGYTNFKSIKYCGGIGKNKWYQVSLNQGRNREVRRMWEHVNCQVNKLIRIRFGTISLPNDLDPGDWKKLNKFEVQLILNLMSKNDKKN